MKKIYVFMLMLLLIGQTILGPMGTVMAQEFESASFTLKEGTLSGADESGKIKEGDTVTLNYAWSLTGPLTEDISKPIDLPEQLQAVEGQGGQLLAGDNEIGHYVVEGNQLIVTVNATNTEPDSGGEVVILEEGNDTGEDADTEVTEVPETDTSSDEEADADVDVDVDTDADTSELTESMTVVATKAVAKADTAAEEKDEVGVITGEGTIPVTVELTENAEGSFEFGRQKYLVGGEDSSIKKPFSEGDFDQEVDISVIHTITAPENIEDLRPQIGDEIKLRIDFTLQQNHNYGDGSILKYSFPTPLIAASGNGELVNEETKEMYASYKVENGEVIIIFNENIRYKAAGGESTGGLEVDGWFEIMATFEVGNNDLEQDLVLPKNGVDETINIKFKPYNGTKVEKSAEAENEGKNSQNVEWNVVVNKEMMDLGDGMIFEDKLTGNHNYDPNSLSVTKMKIGADGKVIPGSETDVTDSFSKLDEVNKSFTLLLKDKCAYTIRYSTIPADTEESDQTLLNSASFNGKTASKSVKITYGEPLTKKVELDGEQATWTIEVNKNRRELKKGLVITDTWKANGDKHKFDGDIVVSLLDSDAYTIVQNDTGFTLTLEKDTSSEFKITYRTMPKDLVTGNISLENEVIRSDRNLEYQKKTDTATYNQNVISKSNSNIDYQNKTVDWKIALNSAGYTMDTIVLDDIFVEKNLKIKEGTFKVSDGNGVVPHNLTKIDSVLNSGDEKGGFKLTIPGPITGPVTITYTTHYDVRGVENLDTYTNRVGVSWKTDNKPYEVPYIESNVDINNQQIKKGYKLGVYNYETKNFEWSVGINYNFDTINNATFIDTLSASQIIDRSSIKVYKLDLTSGGNGVITGNALSEGIDYILTAAPLKNTFTLTFKNEITEPYRIVYESQNEFDYYEPGEGKHFVENKAILTGDGGYSAKWDSKVTVEHTNKLITKEAVQQSPDGAKLNWTLKLNWGQSTLKNAVITDTVGKDSEGNPNQMIYEDSFQICEMNFTGTDTTPKKGTCHKPGEGLYDISFAETDATFKITFNKELDQAYIVNYDSFILGATGESVENSAKLTYESLDETASKEDTNDFGRVFNFSGGASAYKGQLQITKLDEENESEKLSGAKFGLWSAPQNGFLIETVSTDVDGVYTFKTKVGQGDYYLIETESPNGYTAIGSGYEVRKLVKIKAEPANSPNYVKQIEIKNKSIKQAFKIKKVDASDETKTLAGAEFILFHENGEPVEDSDNKQITKTTAENGELVVEKLEPGKYYFIETKAPEHYLLDADASTKKISFEITANQTKIISETVKNVRGTGKLLITKVDANNPSKLLPGAEFDLIDSNGQIIQSGTTKGDGTYTFENLPYDNYKLVEKKAPADYVIEQEEYDVKVSSDTENNITIKKTIKNKKITHSVQLTKYNANETLVLPNAVFELRQMNNTLPGGYKVVTTIDPQKLVTDENGTIYLDKLEPGDYQFVETKAPSGYYVNNEPESFTITTNQISTVNVKKTNNRIPDPVWPGPVEPGKPVDPDKPKPGEEDPNDPNKPGEPGEENPNDPDKPGNPGEEDPNDPNKPDQQGEEDPNDPNNPGQPGEEDPNDPNKPTDPSTTDPTDPNAPGNDDSVEGQEGNEGNATGKPGSAGGSKGQQSNVSGKDTLPQTGEELYLYMTIFGFVLILAGGFMVRRRKINE